MGTAGRTCLVMKDCTRSSHSFCLADIVKSMGRSSALSKMLGRTLALLPLRRKAFAPLRQKRHGMPEPPREEIRGLTFPAFETIVSYNCLKCNPPAP